MANKRSAQGPRGRDLFRAEVSSLLADLGDLTEETGPPVAATPAGAEPAVPERIEAVAPERSETPVPEEIAAFVPEATMAFAPEETTAFVPEEATAFAPEGTTAPEEAMAFAPEGAGPPPPPSIEPPVGQPRPISDEGALLKLEDLPSSSPSYLPPLPPVSAMEAGSAGSPVASSAPWPPPPAAEPGPAPGEPLPQVAEAGRGPKESESPDQGWPEPPDWPLASEPAKADGPFDHGDSEMEAVGAPVAAGAGLSPAHVLEPDPVQLPASDRAATGAPQEEESGPGWHVRVSPTPATIATLAEIPGWGAEAADAAAQPEPPTEAVDHRDPVARTPSLPGPPREPPGSPTWSLPLDVRAVPLGIATVNAAAGVAGGPLRTGLPLPPGGAAAPVSSRPWSLAAAMQPVAPLTPPPARPGAGAAPASEPAVPLAPLARTSGMSLPFPVFAGALFAILAVIVVLIVLDLHR